ncbi:MAG: hypothetical protein KIT85_07420 [Pseudolabrys sp.]|nr:hypothetical protein [Pseudolabrys sp.]
MGDVGDFAKYAVLRALTKKRALRLGVVWYLFGDESYNNDGRHISYLYKPDFRILDPDLHDALKKLVESGRRSVSAVAKAKILPIETIFYDRPISLVEKQRLSRHERLLERASWLRRALARTASCDVVFADPDNGIETPSIPKHSPKGGKYVFFEELQAFWQRGQSLVIYHHLNRTLPVARQTLLLRKRLQSEFSNAAIIQELTYRRGSCRHFWIIGQQKHSDTLRSDLNNFMSSGWSVHFYG